MKIENHLIFWFTLENITNVVSSFSTNESKMVFSQFTLNNDKIREMSYEKVKLDNMKLDFNSLYCKIDQQGCYDFQPVRLFMTSTKNSLMVYLGAERDVLNPLLKQNFLASHTEQWEMIFRHLQCDQSWLNLIVDAVQSHRRTIILVLYCCILHSDLRRIFHVHFVWIMLSTINTGWSFSRQWSFWWRRIDLNFSNYIH